MTPTTIQITRQTLLDHDACNPGIGIWDELNIQTITWDWANCRDSILKLPPALLPYLGWAVDEKIIPTINLAETNLAKANLVNAYLHKANLHNAYLASANLTDAYLVDANLFGANLYNTSMTNTDLTCANLTCAYLRNANLADVCWYNTKYNKHTVWPDGFDPTQHTGLVLV